MILSIIMHACVQRSCGAFDGEFSSLAARVLIVLHSPSLYANKLCTPLLLRSCSSSIIFEVADLRHNDSVNDSLDYTWLISNK